MWPHAIRLFSLALCAVLGCDNAVSHTCIPHFDPHELDALGAGLDEAVMVQGAAVPKPTGGPLRADEMPMRAGPGGGQGRESPGRRSSGFRPDRVTDLEGSLGYYEVFTPAITPFKRVSALDTVAMADRIPVLVLGRAERVPVAVEGLTSAPPDARERDRFWGSVVLDFSEGPVVPLPTVSPESRILALETEPAVAFALAKDGADNFFAVAPAGLSRQLRVTYVLDAPRSYFGAALPESPANMLAAEVSALPERLSRDALAFARELGVSPSMPASTVLRALVSHFRGFEQSREPPRDTGNIYLDLAREKRGVCRHRTYAFVITAQALGIPARFVQNEAHAWAEVKVGELGWMRLDLGGAAEGLEPHATAGRPAYRPQVSDPWPRPLAYEQSYSRAAELAAQKGQGGLERGNESRSPSETRLKPTLALGQGEGTAPLVDDPREALVLRVSRYVPEVMRGGVLEVEGTAQGASGAGVAGLRVEVSLAEPEGERAVLLGIAVTDDQGRFHGSYAVPPDLDPADYALVVVTPGNAKHRAARAD